MFSDKWVRRFARLALEVAEWSDDPNCKVGAVLVSPDKRQVSVGYNGPPSGVDWLPGFTKLELSVHAELNVIFNSPKRPAEYCLFVTKAPCLECAKAIIQSGVRVVVRPSIPESSKWVHSCSLAESLMKASNVAIVDWPY